MNNSRRSYSIGDIVNDKTVVAFRKLKYTVKCHRCGIFITRSVQGINRPNCLCQLDRKTLNIKDKIAEVLEMYFGKGMMMIEIGKHFNMDSSAISYLISKHGFKQKKGIEITLKSKV